MNLSLINIFHLLSHVQPFRLPYLSLCPKVCSNSCPLSRWCHPTISSSVTPFSFFFHSFPASESFPLSWLFVSVGQSVGASASASILPINFQGWFLLGLTGLMYDTVQVFSRVFSSTAIQKHQFLAFSLFYCPILTSARDYWKSYSSDYMKLCQKNDVFSF